MTMRETNALLAKIEIMLDDTDFEGDIPPLNMTSAKPAPYYEQLIEQHVVKE